MSEPKLISPMLDDFSMGDAISEHHGVRCYPAMPNSSDKRYIVKVISIPASQVQLQALLLTGAFQSEDSAREYFHDLAKGIVAETEIITKLSKLEGFIPFENCQIVPMENGVGYDVYLLSPYQRTLARFMRKNNMTHLAAVNLGLDLCASLAVARQCGQVYAGLKPENIYICNDKEYRLGDLGFLPLDRLRYTSLPERSISAYTAPEVVDAYSDINTTLDIYSVGMVLYQVYNGGVLPFEGRAPAEPLPPPEYADYEMAEIIMKAIAPNPADRWEDPITMGQALVAYMQRNSINDTPIVTVVEDHSSELPLIPPESADDEAVEEVSEDAVTDEEAVSDESGATLDEEDAEPEDEQLLLDEFYALLDGDDQETNAQAVQAAEAAPEISEDENDDDGDEDDEDDDDDDPLLNLSFLDDINGDDTAPSEEMAAEFAYDTITDDASDILAQADDLLQHETPEGVVAPEPVDIDTIPIAPVPTPELSVAETINVSIPADKIPTEQVESATAEEAAEESAEADEEADTAATAVIPEAKKEDYDLVSRRSDHRRQIAKKKARRSKVIRRWIAVIIILLLIGGLAFGGYLFYKDYYLCSVISLVPSGSEDRLVVNVTADIDESLLTVYCIDTHGNSMHSPVVNGRATFEGLSPNTLYSLKVEASGLHKLTGETLESYTTPVQTEILTFTAITGTEPGSAILSFTVDGMDSDTWTVTYCAEDEEEKKQIFSGHMVTINGLTAGKTYTFQLDSASELYIIGNDTLEHTAMDPVFAQNLAITGCSRDSLDVRWEAPEGATVESWIVRCYSESGYDETVETAVPYVTFRGLDGNEAHTVEVTAKGMSAGNRCYMTDNAVTVTDVTAEKVGVNELKLTWNFTGNTPTGSWMLTYVVDGSDQQNMVRTDTNSAVISPLIPGAEYEISVILEDGTTVFSYPLSVTTDEAARFSGYFTGADYITAMMVKTPDKANWSRADLADTDYTDTFKSGTRASFLLYTKRNYDTSKDLITTMFVIHDAEGKLISSNITQARWVDMWYKRYCELDIPEIPTAPGTYTIEIYFNGTFLHSQEFTVTE